MKTKFFERVPFFKVYKYNLNRGGVDTYDPEKKAWLSDKLVLEDLSKNEMHVPSGYGNGIVSGIIESGAIRGVGSFCFNNLTVPIISLTNAGVVGEHSFNNIITSSLHIEAEKIGPGCFNNLVVFNNLYVSASVFDDLDSCFNNVTVCGDIFVSPRGVGKKILNSPTQTVATHMHAARVTAMEANEKFPLYNDPYQWTCGNSNSDPSEDDILQEDTRLATHSVLSDTEIAEQEIAENFVVPALRLLDDNQAVTNESYMKKWLFGKLLEESKKYQVYENHKITFDHTDHDYINSRALYNIDYSAAMLRENIEELFDYYNYLKSTIKDNDLISKYLDNAAPVFMGNVYKYLVLLDNATEKVGTNNYGFFNLPSRMNEDGRVHNRTKSMLYSFVSGFLGSIALLGGISFVVMLYSVSATIVLPIAFTLSVAGGVTKIFYYEKDNTELRKQVAQHFTYAITGTPSDTLVAAKNYLL